MPLNSTGKSILIIVAVLIISAGAVDPMPAWETPRDRVRGVLKAYAFKEQMTVIIPLMDLYLSEFKTSLPAEDFAIARDSILECFSAEVLYPFLVDYMSRNREQDYLSVLSKASKSPLIQRVTDLMIEDEQDNTVGQMAAFAQRLRFAPPTPARLELFERFSSATGAAVYGVKIPLICFRSAIYALNPVLSPKKQLSRDELKRLVGKKKLEIKQASATNSLLSFLFSYRGLSDRELSEYLDFLETGEARWLNRMTSVGLIKALGTAAKAARRQVMELIKRTAAPSPVPSVAVGPESKLKTFSRYGFSFSYPDEYFLKEIGLLERRANDASGTLKGGSDNKQSMTFSMFSIAWIRTVRFDLAAALHKGLQDTLETPQTRSFQKGKLADTEKNGHRMLFQPFSVTSSRGEQLNGIVGTFHCTRSDKAFIIMTGDSGGGANVRRQFDRLVESLLCH